MLNPAIAANPIQPPMMANQGPPVPSDNGNPVVAEIDHAHANLSEPAKQAISILGKNSGAPPVATPLISPAVPASPNPAAQPSVADIHKANLARLTGAGPNPDDGKAGVDRIHNKPLSILAHIGDIAESTFLPRAAMFTPGTTLNHNRQIGNAEQAVAQDETQASGASKRGLEHAQQVEQEALPEFHQQQEQNVADKAQAIQDVGEARASASQAETQRKSAEDKAKIDQHLRDTGYKSDPATGKIVPLPYEEMSETQQGAHDLIAAKTEMQDAEAALKKAQAANQPAQVALQQKRLSSAQQAHDIAERRLSLSEKTYEARYHGTENGTPLPGAMLTDSGQPVGSSNAANVRPTATQRDAAGRADTGEALETRIRTALADPELVKGTGPLAGRLSEIEGRVGTLPQGLSTLRNDLKSYGAFQAGMHPIRGIGGLEYFDKVMGGLGQTPEELLGKLDSNHATAESVKKTGTPRTVGSNSAAPARPKGVPANATWNAQGKYWETP